MGVMACDITPKSSVYQSAYLQLREVLCFLASSCSLWFDGDEYIYVFVFQIFMKYFNKTILRRYYCTKQNLPNFLLNLRQSILIQLI